MSIVQQISVTNRDISSNSTMYRLFLWKMSEQIARGLGAIIKSKVEAYDVLKTNDVGGRRTTKVGELVEL